MQVSWLWWVFNNLLHGIDDVRMCGLDQIVELSNNRSVVEVQVEEWVWCLWLWNQLRLVGRTRWVTLIFNVEAQILHYLNYWLELLIAMTYEYTIINIDHKYYITLVEYAIIYEWWLEANGSQFLHKVWVPYSPCLLLSINVSEKLEHMVVGVIRCYLDALWKFHLDVMLDWCMWICHDKVNLAKGQKEYDAKNYN